MAIGRTAKGTATGTSLGSGSLTLAASLALSAGSTLAVAITYNGASGPPNDVVWGGVSLTPQASIPVGVSANMLDVWTLENVSAGTAALEVDDAGVPMGAYRATIVAVTGAATASFDQTASNGGNSTSPSSGNTATTAQANEMLLGFVAQVAASVSGSWSGSFTAGQSVGSGSLALGDGYRSVTATGAYAAAKTGASNVSWGAVIVTLKEGSLTPTSASIGMSAAATMSGLGRANSLAIGMSASGTMGGTRRESVLLYPPADVAAPLGTLTPQQMSTAGSIGVRTSGAPYIAAWMDSPTTTWRISSGGEVAMRIVAALYEPPHARLSATEPHWIASFHEIGGAELYAIGVTPDLRLCGMTRHRGVLLSAPGVVTTDGSFHQYEFSMVTGRTLSIDGVAVAWDLIYPADLGQDGMFSEAHLPCRMMAFNGVAGTTRCACAIMRIEISTENNPFVWSFSEGAGSLVAGGEQGDDIPGVDWTLRLGWFDPQPSYPQLYGAIPDSSPSSAYRWLVQTQYRKATVIRPDYRIVSGGSASGFRSGEGAQRT